MVELGDISKKLKILSLKRGSVFRMELFPQDGVTPKNKGDKSRTKYFVVLGVDGNKVSVCSTLINSEINPKRYNWIGPYQYLISASKYNFLEHKDRYVDCYQYIDLKYDKILDNAEYIGIIDEEDIVEIIKLLKSAPLINNEIERYNL